MEDIKTKEKILQAGRRLFGEHGYHGTSMSSIADACEIKKASLYHFFSGKSDLFATVFLRFLDELLETFQFTEDARFSEVVKESIQAGLDHGQLVFPDQAVIDELKADQKEQLESTAQKTMDAVTDFLSQKGVPNPDFAAQFLQDVNLMYIHRYNAGRNERSVDQHVTVLQEILLK